MSKQQAGAGAELPVEGLLDGRYRLQSEIGAGGLGVVYRATHEKLDREVAVKLLHDHCGGDPVMRGRFEREAKALAALEHPNIVAVTDFGIADDTPYLVMELLEGETLEARLSPGALDASEAETLSIALLQALAFVHGRGLVHRDVKPSNVFLQRLPDAGERIKLLDFGLAKHALGDTRGQASLTRAGSIIGTPAYMSPEQASGEQADARSDVYAVGVIMLEMLSGRLPFDGEAFDQLRSHMIAPVPSLVALNSRRLGHADFERFSARALAKRREDRFADASEMLAALEALERPWFSGQRSGSRSSEIAGNAVTMAQLPSPSNDVGSQLSAAGSHGDERGLQPSAANSSARERDPRTADARNHNREWLLSALLLAVGALYLARPPLEQWMHWPGSDDPSTGQAAESSSDTPNRGRPNAAPEFARPGATSAPHDGLVPPTDSPAANSGTNNPALPLAAAAPSTAADDEAAPEAALHLQPIEHESDEPAPAPPPPTRSRSAARNPWRTALPKELKALRGVAAAGARGNDHAIASLRRYNREHASDTRGHLILANLYFNREWRGDAVNQYEVAYQIDPSVRGASDMLSNLIAMYARGSFGELERFIERAYRSEALPAIARSLRSHRDDARAVTRLSALRARLVARSR